MTRIAVITLIVLAILHVGKVLFVPLFFAILISFILYPACRWMESKGIPRSGAITISLIAALIPIASIVYILIAQLVEIGNSWNLIQAKLNQLPWLKDYIGIPKEPAGKQNWVHSLINSNRKELAAGLADSAATLVLAVIIPVYVAILLFQRHRLLQFIQDLFPESEATRIKSILHETVITYYNFVKGMIVVYAAVGILNSIGLYLLGIPNAFVYGFSVAILTFIPYVGILVGSVMPMITAWAMYDSIYYPLAVAGIFAFVQFLEANLIFPLAVSYRVKVNMLFTIIAIFLGAITWGAAGMILFIPFFAIIKMIADKTEKYKAIGKLLGDEK